MIIKRGLALDDGVEPFGYTSEHGHYGHSELLIRFDPKYPGVKEAMEKFVMEQAKIALNGKYGVVHFVGGDELHDKFGPLASNYHLWLRKIKKAFDPEGTSVSTHYITAKE
jgi:hypothetical protein